MPDGLALMPSGLALIWGMAARNSASLFTSSAAPLMRTWTGAITQPPVLRSGSPRPTRHSWHRARQNPTRWPPRPRRARRLSTEVRAGLPTSRGHHRRWGTDGTRDRGSRASRLRLRLQVGMRIIRPGRVWAGGLDLGAALVNGRRPRVALRRLRSPGPRIAAL